MGNGRGRKKKMVNFKGTSDLSEEKAGKESESKQKI